MPNKDKTGPFGEGKDCNDSRGRNKGGDGFRGKDTGRGLGRRRRGQHKTTEGMLRDQQKNKE